MSDDQPFDEWVILELLGHRRLAGRVREVQLAGAGHGEQTQYVAPGSVYAMHPTTEAIAIAAAANFRPQPVSRWELEAGKADDRDDALAEQRAAAAPLYDDHHDGLDGGDWDG